jgi:hypothetical protein
MTGYFSVQVCLRTTPAVVTSVDRDACWLDLDTFADDGRGHTGITIHLPGTGAEAAKAARCLAEALTDAAVRIDQAGADQAELVESYHEAIEGVL